MFLAHKIELKPNNKQTTYFARSCGVARFAYNWALSEWKKQYQQNQKPNEANLSKKLNSIKAEEFPWMLEVTKTAPQQAIKNLGQAFTRFFKKKSKYPRFKKKGKCDRFRADNGPITAGANAVQIKDNTIKIPKLGWVKMTEILRFKGHIKSLVVSRKANRWFASICIETSDIPQSRKNQGVVGIDLGVKSLAVLSKGEVFTGAKPHTQKLAKLKRLSRQLSPFSDICITQTCS